MKKTIISSIVLIIMFFPFLLINKTSEFNRFSEENIIETILTYNFANEQIDSNFLKWVQTKYGNETLKKLKIYLENNDYDETIWHEITGNSILVLTEMYNGKYENSKNVKIIEGNKEEVTISFIGDVSLADNFEIMPYYDLRKQGIVGILSEDLVNILNNADLLIANNEFTISDRGTPMKNKIYTFRANPTRTAIYNEMGVDLVTLANNHVYDFGYDAFMDTLETLNYYKIPYIGAGKNIEEAREPYYIIINGYKIGFVNATRAEKYILTPEAKENSPGVFRTYDPTMFLETIKKTKENSDYVVALIHWGKEDSHYLEAVQKETGKLYIDSGADVLIGTHAHVLQGIEFYNEKPIVYNIGDFIFNRETKPTGIFNMKLSNDGNLSYSFTPCMQHNFKTTLLYDEKKQEVLNSMQDWSINALFDNDGNITES